MVVNFIVRESKKGKNGLAPLEVSIIVNKERKVFTLDRRVKPSLFNTKSQKVRGDKELNDYIDAVRTKLFSIETRVIKEDLVLTATEVMKYFKNGFTERNKGVLAVFGEFIKEYSKKHDVTLQTISKFKTVNDFLMEFINEEYKISEFPISSINESFIEKFNVFLSNKGNSNNTVVAKLKKLKMVLNYSVANGYIKVNPMFNHKFHIEKVVTIPLTIDEIRRIKDKKISVERLDRVRDIFLLMCYTGLAYCDVMTLTKDDIQDGVIIKNRKKTAVQSVIPMFSTTKEILEKYDYVIPKISNQRLNSYLTELQDICGIKKNLHCHLARHSTATILLNQGVDMQTVSRVLGHSNSKITEAVYSSLYTSEIVKRVKEVESAFI